MKYCCDIMEGHRTENSSLLEYNHAMRSSSFILYHDTHGTHQKFYFCPWCGNKLPENLNEKWDEILEKEYGITEPFFEDKDRVPPEFWTDEWWKKRGL